MFKKKKVVILSFNNDFNIDAIGTHLQNIVQVKISIDNDVHQWAQKEAKRKEIALSRFMRGVLLARYGESLLEDEARAIRRRQYADIGEYA